MTKIKGTFSSLLVCADSSWIPPAVFFRELSSSTDLVSPPFLPEQLKNGKGVWFHSFFHSLFISLSAALNVMKE